MAASGDMASDAQRRLLKMEGANPRLVDSPSLTKREASTWIDELKACGGDQARKTSVAERIPATGASARPATPPAGPSALATPGPAAPLARSESFGFTPEQIDLIKDITAPRAELTDRELAIFLYTARRLGLDPVARQIYAVKYSDRERGGKTLSLQTSIDGYRAIAARSGELDGIEDSVFGPEVAADGGTYPAWASVTVHRKGASHGFTATARWSEYRRLDKEGLSRFWHDKPYTMLGKCAESLALRKAFPADLSGVYTAEEMEQAENPERLPGPPPPPAFDRSKAVDAEAREVPAAPPTPSPTSAGGTAGAGAHPAPASTSGGDAPPPEPPKPADVDPAVVEMVNELEAACHTANAEVNHRRAELVRLALSIRGLKDLRALPLEDLDKLRTTVGNAV
jgi:phage recombination protein Bet